MKRTNAALAALVACVVALLLAGCNDGGTMIGSLVGSTPTSSTINLSDPAVIDALCGDEAADALESVQDVKDMPNSGQRNQALTEWGIKSSDELDELIATITERAKTPCKDVSANADKAGVQNADGTVTVVPIIKTTGDPLVIDSTAEESTPPLLDGDLRFTAQTLSWAGLVERVGDNNQWYIDGVNARAALTGFTWDDVLKFASANKIVDDKIRGTNALAIQVFNQPDLTDEQVYDKVRKYITPKEEAIIGLSVEELPIQRINNGFMNTRNVGTEAFPQMGDAFDPTKMVRVSLMPLVFDSGKAIGLDGSRGAGVFIDCGNLHWVPQAMWFCKGEGCEKPKCPQGMEGTPPNCNPPTPPSGECQTNCNPPDDDKDWSQTPQEDGWVPLGPGPLTDGQESQRQQESGQTSGNVIDNQVPEGTRSGDTTPDLPADTVTAPGATPNDGSNGQPPEDTSDDVVDEEVTNQDDGGTQGDTCVTDPFTGENNC